MLKGSAPTLSLAKPVESIKALLTSQQHFNKLAAMLLLAETVLCLLIIRFVPCECLVGLWYGN